MDREEFLGKMTDILDSEETLTMETKLDDLEAWDSLGILTFLAEMGPVSKSPIQPSEVKKATMISDLYALIR